MVSLLARVEVPAAIWRNVRTGEVAAADASVLTQEFEADWSQGANERGRFIVVGLSRAILEGAAGMAAIHGLRAYDAVQLASAVAARDADASCDSFACFDAELREAAAARGFAVIP